MNNFRNERSTTRDLPTEATNIGSSPLDTDYSSSSKSNRLSHFLKIPSSAKNTSMIGSEAQDPTSLDSTPENEQNQAPTAKGLVDEPINMTIEHEDHPPIGDQVHPIEKKENNPQKTPITSYLYYSMELCNEDTLERRLTPFNLTKQETCNIIQQITETIAYIHDKKLVNSLSRKKHFSIHIAF